MQPDATPAPIGADALRVAAQAALTALENLHEIDTETECITIDVRDEIDALRAALASAAQPVAVPHAQMTEEIDLHRLQHIESAALQALGILWMVERTSEKTQDAFRVLRNALGGRNALRKGIEAAIDAGYEADHPPGADWWAGKKERHHA